MNIEPFTFILERLGQLLIDEIKFLSTDTTKLFQSLQQEVELAQNFVRDVEEEKRHVTISNVLEIEFQHMMQILPRIEDFLDTLNLEDVQRSEIQSSSYQKFKACFSCSQNPLVQRHVAIDSAMNLIKELKDTRKMAKPYQLQGTHPQVNRRRPQTRSNIINNEFIVELKEDVKALVDILTDKNGEGTNILAIVGMGGSGKTTLARMLYKDEVIGQWFMNYCAWVCVSREYDTLQLIREICAQVHLPLKEGETLMTAGFQLQEYLHEYSCFVVIDDVWETSALEELLPLLVHQGSGVGRGRVLVTSRREDILNFSTLGGLYTHKARRLTSNESWDLFSKIVRSKWRAAESFNDESEFAKLGREMLEKCDGLPLAIVALAGLVSTKEAIQDWRTLKNSVSSTILRENRGFHDYGPVKHMLGLSYIDLSRDLEPCFVYLGIFPEDSVIDVNELTQLWIGEGFLRANLCYDGQTLEELGMDFINELVQRCMAEVVRKDYEGKIQAIRVHDLMRDLCIDKAKDSGFFEILSPSTTPSSSMEAIVSTTRRAITHKPRESYTTSSPHLRSVINHGYGARFRLVHGQMRLLRVLHLDQVDLRWPQLQIGDLVLLRYLNMQHCDGVTDEVLESIKNLRNLLAFIFEGGTRNDEKMIPYNMVSRMKHLRWLQLSYSAIIFQGLLFGAAMSRSLQCLRSMAGDWLTQDLHFLTSLRELRLENLNSQPQLDAVSDFVANSSCLQILHLVLEKKSTAEFGIHRMKLECCPPLKTLRLEGKIREQDAPLFFAPNLLDLCLIKTKIAREEDLKGALSGLHQLRCLELHYRSYEGSRITMSGLPQLQNLKIRGLQELNEWRVEGALHLLKNLEVVDCSMLVEIPQVLKGRSIKFIDSDDLPARTI